MRVYGFYNGGLRALREDTRCRRVPANSPDVARNHRHRPSTITFVVHETRTSLSISFLIATAIRSTLKATGVSVRAIFVCSRLCAARESSTRDQPYRRVNKLGARDSARRVLLEFTSTESLLLALLPTRWSPPIYPNLRVKNNYDVRKTWSK